MSMTKVDMAKHKEEYFAKLSEATAAERDRRFNEALRYALASWDHIVGMMQYCRKFEGATIERLEAIDLVLRLAPAFMDFQSINKLEGLLRDRRQIQRHVTADLGAALTDAKARLRAAYTLWDQLEREVESIPLSEDKERSHKEILTQWQDMGLVRAVSIDGAVRVILSTRMNETVRGKCPSCGAIGKAEKARFLEEHSCPRCHTRVIFVILASE
jgi:hypothetical protein